MPTRRKQDGPENPNAEAPDLVAGQTPSAVQSQSRVTPGAKPGTAFDLWLERGLHKLFDNIAQEPIPEALLKIIEQDRTRR